MDPREYKAPLWLNEAEKDDVILWLQGELAEAKQEIERLKSEPELFDEGTEAS